MLGERERERRVLGGKVGDSVGGVDESVGSGDTTPCRITGVAVHSLVQYKEI